MATIIDSLLVSLGFQVNPEGLEKFAKNVEHVKDMAKAVFGFEIVKHVGEFVERTIEAAAQVNDLAETFDISAESMAAMGKVAATHSSDLATMAAAYGSVSRMAGQAAMGIGRGAKMFAKLGLHAKDGTGKAKSGIELMGDVVDKLSKKGTTELLGMAGMLGIDPLLAKQMAKMGREQLMKELAQAEKTGLLTNEDYEVADQTDIAFKQLHGTVRSFFTLIAVKLGPTVKELNLAFREWVGKNRDLIKQKTKEFFDRVREVGSKVIDVVSELAKHTTLLKIIFGAIIAQKMGGAVSGWIGPLWKFTAGLKNGAAMAETLKGGLSGVKSIVTGGLLAALGLAIEDLWAFYQGGESVTGWLLDRFPYAVEVAKGAIAVLGAAILGLVTGSGPLALLAVGLGGFVIAAQDLKDAWNPVMQWLGEQWDRVADKIRLAAKVAAWPVWLVAKVTGRVDDVFGKDKVANIPKTPEEYAAQAAQQEGVAYKRPQAGLGVLDFERGNMMTWGPGLAAAGAGGGGSTTITQTVGPTTIQVNGAGDPQKVAAEVIREQERRRQLARSQTRDAQTAHR